MKKGNFNKKGTWAALVTAVLIAAVSIGVLANSARLTQAFDPDDYRRFDDWEDFAPDYDSVAGDGDESDLADLDEDGEDRGADSQQDIRTEENLLGQMEADPGREDAMGLSSEETAEEEEGEQEVNPDAYELTDRGGVGTLGVNLGASSGSATGGESSGSGSGAGRENSGSGGNAGGGSATPRPTSKPEASSTPVPTPTRKPATPTPTPSWEQQQLSPDKPVMTKEGELTALRVSVPSDWTFFRGDPYSDEGVTVEAAVRNSGKTSYLPLTYGGSDGYSVAMSTETVGNKTAVFSYLGVTARRDFKVISSRVSVRYLLEDNYVAEFPGPLKGSEAELAALRGLDTYPGQGGFVDLRKHHSYMIAFLGDESVRAEFEKDHNYASAMFLETDQNGYLVNMLTGFQYVLQRVIQDKTPYIFYPVSNWGDYTGRSVANIVAEVPAGYKIRREVTETGSLVGYTGEQVLTGYDGRAAELTVPEGTTKIVLEEGAPNKGVASLTIPESVGTVDAVSVARAFPGLQRYEITGHSSYRVVDGALYSGDGTTLLSLPPSAQAPAKWPEELTAIGKGAFYGNAAEELVLPESIRFLEEGCFAGFSGKTVRFSGDHAPAIAGNPELEGKLLVADSEYDRVYREWMFALGESGNHMRIGAADVSGNEIASKQSLYRYDEKNRVLTLRSDVHCLAAVPADCGGRFSVPETFTSVNKAAFAGCEGLREIEIPGNVRLRGESLVLPAGVRSIILLGSSVQVDPHVFGSGPAGDLTIYVPHEAYDGFLADWRDAIDSVYGAGTTKGMIEPWDDSVFIEDNARYQKLLNGGREAYALLGVYGGTGKSFRVKEGTVEIAEGAFAGLSELEMVCLPGSLVRVGKDVFAGCSSLQTIADGSAAALLAGEAKAEAPEGVLVYTVGKSYKSFLCDETGALYGLLADGGAALLDVPTDVEGTLVLRDDTAVLEKAALRDCRELEAVDLQRTPKLREIGASCFENCISLAGPLELGACTGLKTIGSNAFFGCASLEEVHLPGQLEKLKKGVFSGCESLSVMEGTGVSSIGEECFYGCGDLGEIDLSGVVSVGDRAFGGCSSLKTLGKCDKLKKLGMQAFMGCSSLAEVKLPKTLTTMNEECFRDCSALKTVSLQGKVTAVSRYCFFGCQSLEKVTFSKNQKKLLRVIGVKAFGQCGTLTTIDLRGLTALQEMGDQAFANCGSLSIVILPKNLKSLPDNCFMGCGSLSILTLLAGNPPTLGKDVLGEKLPPYLHLWVKKDSVKTYLSAYRKKLDKKYGTGVTKRILGVFDESKEIIGGVTYMQNKDGKRVLQEADKNYEGSCQVLADTVEIADEAFKGCTKLTGLVLPAGSSIQLGDRCFEGCRSLENVNLLGNIPAWGEDTFRNCTGLKDLRFGASDEGEIVRIGTRAFMGCTGLEGTASVGIQTPVLTFGEGCFADCTELEGIAWSVAARETVQVFEDRVFENCTSMKASINSSFKGLQSIGAYAFADCDSLENPSIPAAVTVLGEGCFADCDKLATVSIYGAVEEYPDYCFRNCAKMTRTGGTAAAFSALKRIGEGTYEGCASLNSSTETTWYLAKYENLEEIGSHAFRNCTGLTRDVSFAAGLKRIGAGAFDGCTGLAEIVLASETPPEMGLFAPDSMAEGFTLRVPDSLEEGDRVYLAYRKSLTTLLGREQTDAILDSLTDGARERNLPGGEPGKQDAGEETSASAGPENTAWEAGDSEERDSGSDDLSGKTGESAEENRVNTEGEMP